jgi:aminoglycoside phosphotransferase (APT) family kinase protein
MHENEVDTDPSLVERLLAAQFPHWAALPIEPVESAGTEHAIYRLGDDMAVRLPRLDSAVAKVEKEQHWLPRLGPLLPLAIPVPLAKGRPGEGFPWHWSVYRWIAGEHATLDQLADPVRAAVTLAEFLTALQRIDTSGGPLVVDQRLRGVPLAMRDGFTRRSIASLSDGIDTEAATALWDASLGVSEWNRAPVWFHGDVLSGNLLFARGDLCAVIDFAGLGVGDPACDLMIAWGLFSGDSRQAFRDALGVDAAAWARGRGHALSQAVQFIPYYLDTNPVGVANARRLLAEVIADYNANG